MVDFRFKSIIKVGMNGTTNENKSQCAFITRTNNMEWGAYENNIAIVALHRCGMLPTKIVKTWILLSINERLVFHTLLRYKETNDVWLAKIESASCSPNKRSYPRCTCLCDVESHLNIKNHDERCISHWERCLVFYTMTSDSESTNVTCDIY